MKLKVLNREYNCHFGLGFLGEVIDVLDVDYGEFLAKYEKNPFKYVPLVMYQSIKYSTEMEGEKLGFEHKDLINWIDENGGLTNQEMIDFSQAFIKSLTKNVPKEEVSESNEPKKK